LVGSIGVLCGSRVLPGIGLCVGHQEIDEIFIASSLAEYATAVG
jgi:hypothetical protein